ncbi:MAG: amidase [Gammaproteobacteria bacterium]|nr:amidase [Gammaproteobacteria bacterium]
MKPDPTALSNHVSGAFCREENIALAPTGSGVLSGLTAAIKDVFEIAGTRNSFGNPAWLRTHPPATSTAPVVEALRAAGATIAGKTICDELCYSISGENAHYGTPLNPAAPDRVPGGSSSGSVSAVACALVDFAIGTDCGGSVRIPASYCGVLGIRPTHGRVPAGHVIPFAPSFDVVGWFARDPALFARIGSVLMGEDAAPAAPRRLLVASDAFALVAPEVTAACSGPVEEIAKAFPERGEITVSPEGLVAWYDVFRTVQAGEIWANHGAWIEAVKPAFGRGVKERLEWASQVTPEMMTRGRSEHARIRAHLDALLAPGDVLCLPTSPRAAPRRNEEQATMEIEFRLQAMRLLCIAGLGGLPQVTLPLASLDGLPLGVSLVGARGTDRALLALAERLMRR